MRTPKQTRLQQLNALRRAVSFHNERGQLAPPTPGNVTELRTLAGLNRSQFAAALGVPTQYVTAWERGDYAPPPDKTVLLFNFLDNEIKSAQP